MKNFAIGATILFAAICVSGLVLVGWTISTLNTDTNLKNGVKTQTEIRNAHFDKMWKVIQQNTQITKVSAETRLKLVEALVQGRGAAVIKIVHESNPESAFSGEDYARLSNSVEGQRESFFREEKFLLSKYQEYITFRESAVSGSLLSLFGRETLSPPITITSDKTKDAAASGSDNDTKLDI